MSSRQTEKEQRKQERLAVERELQAQARRARRLRLVGAGTAALLAVGAVAGLAVTGTGGGDASASDGAFGTNFDGLEERRKKAKVPTMMDTMGSPTHDHAAMDVHVDGELIRIPANIGIDPDKDGMAMAGLHTHDPQGTLHIEGMKGATLGQFFEIWGVPFSKAQLGPNKAQGGKVVRMWVDGKPSDGFGDLKLRNGQNIVVSFGPENAPPPAGV